MISANSEALSSPLSPASRSGWPKRCSISRNAVVMIVALLIFGATFRAGIDRGMDKMVAMGAYERILNALSAIMTEQRYRQGGYVVSSCIYDELESRGFSGNPGVARRLGTTFPENLRARYLDEALENMQRDLPQVPDH